MMHEAAFSPTLIEKLKHIKKKDKNLFKAVKKKIQQITQSDEKTIHHYKNLRGELNHLKRVHVGCFVLTFKVKEDLIIFEDVEHHDNAYKR